MQQQVLILAGGFGKRIKKVWDAPKGLIPIWGKTILWYVLKEIEEMGIYKKVVIVSNERHQELYKNYCRENNFEYDIKLLSDWALTPETARGAIVDLQIGLKECDSGGVLVLPCDTVTKGVFRLIDLVKFGQDHPDGVTVVARETPEEDIVGKFGNVKMDASGKLVEFVEKPKVAISKLAAAAIYYFPDSTRKWVDEYLAAGGNPESPGMIIPWLLEHGNEVYVYQTQSGIMDVGMPQELEWAKSQK